MPESANDLVGRERTLGEPVEDRLRDLADAGPLGFRRLEVEELEDVCG